MFKLVLDILRSDNKTLYLLYLLADEIVVEMYLKEQITFSQMPLLAEKIVNSLSDTQIPTGATDKVVWYREMKNKAKEVSL